MDRTDYLKTIPETMKRVFAKAFEGKSLRSAITAKCYDCSCFQRSEAQNCNAVNCPLFELRPGKNRFCAKPSTTVTHEKNQDPKNDKAAARGEGLKKWRENQRQNKINKEGLK